MFTLLSPRSRPLPAGQALLWAGVLALAAGGLYSMRPGNAANEPWTVKQVIEPSNLAQRLSSGKSQKPRILCVGFDFLYKDGHIPGAAYAGPARDRAGIERLKEWAGPLPRSQEMVIYCGCCPMRKCPNVRPAFRALEAMGFRNLRVLDLENTFVVNWTAKGYPTTKGK